jgi:PEP-CTERM motif-containing protein
MKNFFIASVVAVTVVASSGRAQTATLAQWTFETAGATNGMTLAPGAGGNPGSIVADNGLNSTGSTASGLHVGASTYSIPAGDVDPVIGSLVPPASPAYGPGLPSSAQASNSPSAHAFSANTWAVGDYWQFTTSTLGYTGVNVYWDQSGSATGPQFFSLEYSNSLTGGAFVTLQGPMSVGTAATTWNSTTVGALSTNALGGGVFDNSSTVIFRLVDTSTTSINGGTVASGGTDRVDNFTVVGVPEPSTVTLVGAGLLGLLALRRRRS